VKRVWFQWIDIVTEPITPDEIRQAINKLKNGKAAGIDEIQADLLKGADEIIVQMLTRLCINVWDCGEVLNRWQEGIILPLHKKGNLTDCNNWRGITLLSVPGKVLASVILNRLKSGVEKDL